MISPVRLHARHVQHTPTGSGNRCSVVAALRAQAAHSSLPHIVGGTAGAANGHGQRVRSVIRWWTGGSAEQNGARQRSAVAAMESSPNAKRRHAYLQ